MRSSPTSGDQPFFCAGVVACSKAIFLAKIQRADPSLRLNLRFHCPTLDVWSTTMPGRVHRLALLAACGPLLACAANPLPAQDSTDEVGDSGSTDSIGTDSTDSSETGEQPVPGACLGEVDDPQPDTFAGDGVADLAVILRAVDSEPPAELIVGAHLHLQGSYFDCCDDDISVAESVVVRAYPSERIVLAYVAAGGPPPVPADSFFAAIGEDLDSWLSPFVLSAQDDMLCPEITEEGLDAVLHRPSLHVDAGSCETAQLLDQGLGAFGEVFFVSANQLREWVPSGETVDTISESAVFLSRQVCEPGNCPPTTMQELCPAPAGDPHDFVVVSFSGYPWQPPADGYDLVCEILAQTDDGDLIEYALDCGAP